MRYLFALFCLSFGILSADREVINLKDYERRIYSQDGEDGIIEKLFELFGTTNRYCVEFGAADGSYMSNTLHLRENGWQALLLDIDNEDLSMNLHKENITRENITQVFDKYHVPLELDFLSIDIDFNDFYVWHGLHEKYRPRIICIEHNAGLGLSDRVVPYDPNWVYDGGWWSGASIVAFDILGKAKGYTLIYSDSTGLNLFFVRNDLLEERDFTFINLGDVRKIYNRRSLVHTQKFVYGKEYPFLTANEAMQHP